MIEDNRSEEFEDWFKNNSYWEVRVATTKFKTEEDFKELCKNITYSAYIAEKNIKVFYEVYRNTPLGYKTMGRFIIKENAQKLADEWNKSRSNFDLAYIDEVVFDDN